MGNNRGLASPQLRKTNLPSEAIKLASAAAMSLFTIGFGIAPASAARFELSFFIGASEGNGTLQLPFGRRQVHVRSEGRFAGDGSLILDQVVAMARKPPRNREWRIREVAPGRFAGSLSDAAGPVAGDRIGNALRLRYRIKGGFAVEQRLELSDDGQAAYNHMTVRKFGIVFARLDEVISRRS